MRFGYDTGKRKGVNLAINPDVQIIADTVIETLDDWEEVNGAYNRILNGPDIFKLQLLSMYPSQVERINEIKNFELALERILEHWDTEEYSRLSNSNLPGFIREELDNYASELSSILLELKYKCLNSTYPRAMKLIDKAIYDSPMFVDQLLKLKDEYNYGKLLPDITLLNLRVPSFGTKQLISDLKYLTTN